MRYRCSWYHLGVLHLVSLCVHPRGRIIILWMLFCAGLICRGCAVAGNLEWSGGGCETKVGVTRRTLHQAMVIDIWQLIWRLRHVRTPAI